MSVTLLIVDLLPFCVCCIRSGVKRCSCLMMHYLNHMYQCGYMWCPGRTSVTYVLPRCQTLQYSKTFVNLSVSLWNDLAEPVFDCVGLQASRAGPMLFISPSCSIPTIVFYYFSHSLLPVYRLVLWGWGLWTDTVYITLSRPCTAGIF